MAVFGSEEPRGSGSDDAPAQKSPVVAGADDYADLPALRDGDDEDLVDIIEGRTQNYTKHVKKTTKHYTTLRETNIKKVKTKV